MSKFDKNNSNQDIEIDIINIPMKLIFKHFLGCFAEKRKIEALRLLQTDINL